MTAVILIAAVAAAPGPPSVSGKEIGRLIDQLGSARYAERQEAARKLEKVGDAAVAALMKAADGKDVELRRGARCAGGDRVELGGAQVRGPRQRRGHGGRLPRRQAGALGRRWLGGAGLRRAALGRGEGAGGAP